MLVGVFSSREGSNDTVICSKLLSGIQPLVIRMCVAKSRARRALMPSARQGANLWPPSRF
eukprot:634595-Amphidinium_carterae.1